MPDAAVREPSGRGTAFGTVVSRLSAVALLRGRSIRTHLIVLVLATLVPLLAFIAVVLTLKSQLEERVSEERLIDLARVLAVAVDRDLRAVEAALDVLAQSPLLDRSDLRAFYRQALDVSSRHGGWIILTDRRALQVLNTARPLGAPLPPSAILEIRALAVRTRTSYISDVYLSPELKRPVVSVGMPVVRKDDVPFVLDMGLLPERVAALLQSPHLDASWTVRVFDRKGVLVAAVPDEGEAGSSPPTELMAAMRDSGSGWVSAATPGSAAADVAFASVSRAGWRVAIGVPPGAAYVEVTRSLHAIIYGGLAVLAIGVLLAAVLGRRIAAPLTDLAAAAARDDTRPEVASAVAEIRHLQDALHAGRVGRQRAERERQERAAEAIRRAAAEERLVWAVASEARWRALFEQASEAILIGDAEGICRDANPAACRLLGDAIVGTAVGDMVVPEERSRVGDTLASLRTGATHVGEWTVLGPGGRRIPVEVNARVLADGRWQSFVRDVSERREIEHERSRVLALERSARAEAEAASRMKDEFLATLSHELRTPLNTIATWSRLLLSGRLDPAQTLQGLRIIHRSVHAQSILMRDLLDMTRIIRDKLALDVQHTNLSAIVRDACEALRPSAETGGVALHCADEGEITAACDPDRLQQVVWNLLTNALKFTPAGGRVDVRLERLDAEQVRLVVTDTGRGIPREFLPRLFNRFQQLDEGGPALTRGLGIGLALVKHLVECHGGRVTADSPGPGRGATFTVVLPLAGPPSEVRPLTCQEAPQP